MIDSAALLADLKRQLRVLEDDLRVRAEDSTTEWGARLRAEHRRAQSRKRTGLAWIQWRDGEVSQAAVAWIIASVFIRFSEDNGLLEGAKRDGHIVAVPWFASPGDGLERAVENETAFYSAKPTRTTRDWLMDAFTALADLPAGRPLVDPDHSAIWQAPISAPASDALLAFFRRTTPDGALVHDFSDPDLDTRFLGDLYQDLSDYAKKIYALLQTPLFVEELILDLTLTPAIAEFGLTGLKVIDPACGSGHFLLGTFHRLVAEWAAAAPALDKGELVQRALDSVHGVDLNPFAIAIARFRLTVAALKSAGLPSLVGAPAFKFHLAIGDSLLGGATVNEGFDLGDGDYFQYAAEDLTDYTGMLEPGQYDVVVANPPYIQPRDAQLRDRYRTLYSTCHGKYALSVPFMELLFRLAKRPGTGSGPGHVGQITSNSFMKREFGKKVIEQFLSGAFTGVSPGYVDLSHIIDTSGAYIPGHGTPTVILVGRPRKPLSLSVRAVLGIRGEPTQPSVPANGLVWSEISAHTGGVPTDGQFVSVVDIPRERFTQHPWSLSGGGAIQLKTELDARGISKLGDFAESIGITSFTLEDDAYIRPASAFKRSGVQATRSVVVGEEVRDWAVRDRPTIFFPYDLELTPRKDDIGTTDLRAMWPYRTNLKNGVLFGGVTKSQAGLHWTEFGRLTTSKFKSACAITFANVQTHNHFVLDRLGSVFTSHAPIIKLSRDASEEEHFALIGVLNSSTACFWLKQVSHDKGNGGIGGGIASEAWERFFDFSATKLNDFPLPPERGVDLVRRIDQTVVSMMAFAPLNLLEDSGPSALQSGRENWEALRLELVALQEELDWMMYVSYGLADPDLAPSMPHLVPIDANERAFEIQLARSLESGGSTTEWFARHRRSPNTTLPAHWPKWYEELVRRRIEMTHSVASLRLLEQPEFKRRWAGASWVDLLKPAVREAVLNRFEDPKLWKDESGRPRTRSIAQLADELRHDNPLRELLVILTGSSEYDLSNELARLLHVEAVPAFAALRYKPAGFEKFRTWEHTWDLQRAEDRGERVDVPMPPKYAPADFLKSSYWTARGKLDVPKERFIAFPGSHFPEDSTGVFGWAGWDHGQRGQAIARFANDLAGAGATDDQVIPLVGALIELEPWLKQWHDEIGPTGVSPAGAVAGVITALLGRLGVGRDTIADWRPTQTNRRGRSNA